jgi:endonuclease/exonuclease/phosphatase family metal-dependent hydrolase
LEHAIEREPYTFVGQFRRSNPVKFISFHAVPSDKGPEEEIAALAQLPEVRDAARVIIAGDFNMSSEATDTYFVPFGYVGHIHEKTTLKKTPSNQGVYTHRQYDNIYTKGVTVCASGSIDFVNLLYHPVTPYSLAEARAISDHLPVYIWFK